ncbi:MFS transporter [Clostridium omnivorum]|uniref:MFS transporter n=1 Tax=Clostridium omnivorum TaxID=1604902 RepID=A0ABQ5N5J3_9CLOT|nr:MFS transporter [Clostridium sp. E14]GLC30513.1 MFS transporter [Clostridium sp. E14]
MNKNYFSRKELLFLITISIALGIRQMAMTMVMPFISTYSKILAYSTPTLAGVALGIFGLTQAIFQIPFGIWSDKVGNKLVMLFGIMEVVIGLIIAYLATNIYLLIFARALQGSGAILAVGYSWVTGSVCAEKRPRALSILGTIIGVAAASSFALGSIVNKILSVKDMFLVCAALIFVVWVVILVFLKEEDNSASSSEIGGKIDIKGSLKTLLSNKLYVRLNLAGFINNFIMTGVFFIIPQYLDKITGMSGMWKVFMPAVIIAVICMRRVISFVEKGHSLKVIVISYIIIAIGVGCFFNKSSFYFILIGAILFMTGYILLNTVIPSVANDIAEDSYRGTANGIINSFQYVGSFVGSVAAGALWSNHESLVLIVLIVMSLLGVATVKINIE